MSYLNQLSKIIFLIFILFSGCRKERLITENQHQYLPKNRHQPNDQIEEQNLPPISIRDIDGNVYHTVRIGKQTWMMENLKVSRYNDGTPIKNYTDLQKWSNASSGAYCWYDNDLNHKNLGALYNWHAISSGKLAPEGWRIPSLKDWEELTAFIGGKDLAGGALKEKGYQYWFFPNTAATDDHGFSALAAGGIGIAAGFQHLYKSAFFWTSSTHEWNPENVHYVHMSYNHGGALFSNGSKQSGFSVRCIKNE